MTTKPFRLEDIDTPLFSSILCMYTKDGANQGTDVRRRFLNTLLSSINQDTSMSLRIQLCRDLCVSLAANRRELVSLIKSNLSTEQ